MPDPSSERISAAAVAKVAAMPIRATAQTTGVASLHSRVGPVALFHSGHAPAAMAISASSSEVLTATGSPYSVFTPYKNAWLRKVNEFYLRAWPVARHASALAGWPARVGQPGVPALSDIGFEPSDLHTLKLPTGSTGARELLDDFLHRIDLYEDARNFPAVKGPSYLSTHLRFGSGGCPDFSGQILIERAVRLQQDLLENKRCIHLS